MDRCSGPARGVVQRMVADLGMGDPITTVAIAQAIPTVLSWRLPADSYRIGDSPEALVGLGSGASPARAGVRTAVVGCGSRSPAGSRCQHGKGDSRAAARPSPFRPPGSGHRDPGAEPNLPRERPWARRPSGIGSVSHAAVTGRSATADCSPRTAASPRPVPLPVGIAGTAASPRPVPLPVGIAGDRQVCAYKAEMSAITEAGEPFLQTDGGE